MSRPVREAIELRDGLDLAVIEFVARKNAELAARPEKRDRDHKGAGKLEGVVLCEGEICVHRRAPSLERAVPARWLPSVSGTGRDHREGKAEWPHACVADPAAG